MTAVLIGLAIAGAAVYAAALRFLDRAIDALQDPDAAPIDRRQAWYVADILDTPQVIR